MTPRTPPPPLSSLWLAPIWTCEQAIKGRAAPPTAVRPATGSAGGRVACLLVVLFFLLRRKENGVSSVRTGIPASDAGCSTTDPTAFREHCHHLLGKNWMHLVLP